MKAVVVADDKEKKAEETLKEALAHERRVIESAKNFLASQPDRQEAERIVLEKHAPLIDAALAGTRKALTEWLSTLKKLS